MLQGITDQKFRYRVTAIFTVAFVLLMANVAAAAWLAQGSGSGYAQAGNAVPLETVDIGGSTIGQLYPGGDADVILEIQNDNPYNVKLDSLVAGTGDITVESGAAGAGCTASTHHVTFDAPGSAFDKVVGAHDTLIVVLDDAASMGHGSHTDCQGATFDIPVTFSGTSTADEAVADDTLPTEDPWGND